MTTTQTVDVLIVGGGPTGIFIVICLAIIRKKESL